MTKIDWLNAETSKPPVDKKADWSNRIKQSVEVLTYSKEFGKRFGRYYHSGEFWAINGVDGFTDIKVTHYAFVNDPED